MRCENTRREKEGEEDSGNDHMVGAGQARRACYAGRPVELHPGETMVGGRRGLGAENLERHVVRDRPRSSLIFRACFETFFLRHNNRPTILVHLGSLSHPSR